MVDQARLAGQALAVLGDPDEVANPVKGVATGEHADPAGVAVDLTDVPAEPPGDRGGVQFGLHDDPAAHDVQATGEPEQCSDLGLALERLGALRHGTARP